MKRKVLGSIYIIIIICFIFFNNTTFSNKEKTRDTEIVSLEDSSLTYNLKENGRYYKIVEKFNEDKTEIFATEHVRINDKYLLYRDVHILEGENGFTEEKYNYMTLAILIVIENIIVIILTIPVIIYFFYRKRLK